MAVELELASEKPSTLPPRASMADSKERRVRVEGSKNSVASCLWAQASWYLTGFSMMSSAVAMSWSISATDRSMTSMMFLGIWASVR